MILPGRTEVEIHHSDFPAFKAKRLQIGENCRQVELFPETLEKVTVQSSRMLEGLENKSVQPKATIATSFSSMAKELTPNV